MRPEKTLFNLSIPYGYNTDHLNRLVKLCRELYDLLEYTSVVIQEPHGIPFNPGVTTLPHHQALVSLKEFEMWAAEHIRIHCRSPRALPTLSEDEKKDAAFYQKESNVHASRLKSVTDAILQAGGNVNFDGTGTEARVSGLPTSKSELATLRAEVTSLKTRLKIKDDELIKLQHKIDAISNLVDDIEDEIDDEEEDDE